VSNPGIVYVPDFYPSPFVTPPTTAGVTIVPNLEIDRRFILSQLLALPWERHTEARQELFQAPTPVEYTYGKGPGTRTYTASPLTSGVADVLSRVNHFLWQLTMEAAATRAGPLATGAVISRGQDWGPMSGCFLNRYDDQHQALGWHADDFRGMDHSKAVCVVSFGAERELWWRVKGQKGIIPPEQRIRMVSGSLLVMPPGMQHTHDHRVPKADHAVGPRVSLTFRAFL